MYNLELSNKHVPSTELGTEITSHSSQPQPLPASHPHTCPAFIITLSELLPVNWVLISSLQDHCERLNHSSCSHPLSRFLALRQRTVHWIPDAKMHASSNRGMIFLLRDVISPSVDDLGNQGYSSMWAFTHTTRGSSGRRLPKVLCMLTLWFSCRAFCWPVSKIKVFTMIKGNI